MQGLCVNGVRMSGCMVRCDAWVRGVGTADLRPICWDAKILVE